MAKKVRRFSYKSIQAVLLVYIILSLCACGSEQAAIPSPTTAIPSPASTTKAPTILPTTVATTPTIVASPPDWQYSWLKGIPCKAPCFEGITPGKTTAAEAETILRQKLFSGDYSTKSSSLIVNRVTPRFDRNVSFKLADIINAYGEPDLISAEYRPPHNAAIGADYSIRILYLTHGIAIFHSDFDKKPVIDANYSLDYVFFFAPGLAGFYDAYGTPEKVEYTLVPWQGYNTFNFYCTKSYDVFKDCSQA